MNIFPYQRVDVTKLPVAQGEEAVFSESKEEQDTGGPPPGRVRWWIIPLSLIFCIVQATLTILGDNVFNVVVTSTLIPVIGFAFLMVLVLAVNPVLGLLSRKRKTTARLNRIELICLFTSMFVTSSFSTFGLAAHVVPLIPAPWNPEWNTPQSGWSEHLTNPDNPVLNPSLYLQDETLIRMFREGVVLAPPQEGAALGDYLGHYAEVFGMIPWGAWFGPVFWWLVFCFGCIGIFYSLAWVLLRFWADREKLIFPLAQLPAAILPSDSSRKSMPAIFRHPGFWAGFALTALIMSWNAAVGAGWVLPNFRIPLGLSAQDFSTMVTGSWIEGLGGSQSAMRFLIIFTAIGIAFLLPTQISFSTWAYFLIGQLMVLVAVWIGLAQNARDFPSDFVSTANFLTAQGGGALMALAAICLYRSLKEYYMLSCGRPLAERLKILTPVLWLIFFICLVFAWLLWNQITPFWALAFLLFFTLFTIGMMRVVSETGIYFFQANFGFFHAFNSFGIGKIVPGALIAPLVPIYSIFFMDIKTFAAPNLMNSSRMQKENGHGRRMYHWNMILCIVVSVLFSIGLLIFLAHERGGQQLESWFFNHMAARNLDHARNFINETRAAFDANAVWVLIGAAWLCLSLYIRKSVFWFPHPIGYILLFNPLLASIWFSFFIGWLFKSVCVKYGGKSTFDLLKPIFIGLIFGEIMAIVFWLLLGIGMDFSPGIDLNRTGP